MVIAHVYKPSQTQSQSQKAASTRTDRSANPSKQSWDADSYAKRVVIEQAGHIRRLMVQAAERQSERDRGFIT